MGEDSVEDWGGEKVAGLGEDSVEEWARDERQHQSRSGQRRPRQPVTESDAVSGWVKAGEKADETAEETDAATVLEKVGELVPR